MLVRPTTLAVAIAFAVFSAPANAQEDELRTAAESYVNSPAQQQMIDGLLDPESIMGQIRSARPDVPKEVVESIGQIASEELTTLKPQLEEAMVEAAVQTFTLDEIKAVDAFYRSPEGQAILAKSQDFMQAAMTEIGPKIQAAQQNIAARAQEVINSAQ